MSLKDNLTSYFQVNEFKENIVNLIEAKIGLVKIDFQEKIDDIIAKIIYIAILAFSALIVLIFLNVLLAVFINHWLDSFYLGFILVGAFYALILLIWILAKNSVFDKIKRVAEKVTDAQFAKK